jgi:hypothetical protein
MPSACVPLYCIILSPHKAAVAYTHPLQLDQASRRRDTHKTYAERLLKAVKQRAASKAAANNQQDQVSCVCGCPTHHDLPGCLPGSCGAPHMAAPVDVSMAWSLSVGWIASTIHKLCCRRLTKPACRTSSSHRLQAACQRSRATKQL